MSEEDFLRHIAEKYRIRFPQKVTRLAEPIVSSADSLKIAAFCIKQKETRTKGLIMYDQAKADLETMITTGLLDSTMAQYIREQFEEIRKSLGRFDLEKTSELMDRLGIDLHLLAAILMASQAERI